MSVVIVDYGLCNLDSVNRAVEECGYSSAVSRSPADLENASRIILPGVGNFAAASSRLENLGLSQAIKSQVSEKKTPILGICLGMQLLATESEEGGLSKGLDLIRGQIIPLKPVDTKERIPHVGWNSVEILKEHSVFRNIQNGSDFYFVHSYCFKPADSADILTTTPYCGDFASTVGRGHVVGVQFHPEKSLTFGLQLLKNFLSEGASC